MTKQRLSKSQSNKIKRAIFHERHKNSYFWDTPIQASHRRKAERENSYIVKFRLAGDHTPLRITNPGTGVRALTPVPDF